jgi:hypothetical protein
MRTTLIERDIGNRFDIFFQDEDDEFNYIGNGILSHIGPSISYPGLENYNYNDNTFSHFTEDYLDKDSAIETSQFRAGEGIFQFLERRKIDPQLKRDLERRIYTRKNGRMVNELSHLPLAMRQNVFEFLTKEKVPDPSKKNRGGKSKKKRRRRSFRKR